MHCTKGRIKWVLNTPRGKLTTRVCECIEVHNGGYSNTDEDLPTPSKKYRETTCVAGVTRDGIAGGLPRLETEFFGNVRFLRLTLATRGQVRRELGVKISNGVDLKTATTCRGR
jgi:hypothetical protein